MGVYRLADGDQDPRAKFCLASKFQAHGEQYAPQRARRLFRTQRNPGNPGFEFAQRRSAWLPSGNHDAAIARQRVGQAENIIPVVLFRYGRGRLNPAGDKLNRAHRCQ